MAGFQLDCGGALVGVRGEGQFGVLAGGGELLGAGEGSCLD